MNQLSTLDIGSFFKLATAPAVKPDEYVLTKYSGSVEGSVVVVNRTKSQIVEMPSTTMVIEMSLSTTTVPMFTLA